MPEKSNFEKFLAKEPLTPELAALRAGNLPIFDLPEWMNGSNQAAAPLVKAGNEPLAKNERNALREMRLSAGWQVFQKLLRRAIMRHTDAAVSISQVDPLRNSQAIAESWAYVHMLKRVHQDINLEVDLETSQEADTEETEDNRENDAGFRGAQAEGSPRPRRSPRPRKNENHGQFQKD
jgi:hypothetical protein